MEDNFPDDDDVDDNLLSSISIDNLIDKKSDQVIPLLTEKKVNLPPEFPFPFQPYDIQINFMTNLYTALEQAKVGIFESPTGTGKSLSLICGALTWLKDFERNQALELEKLKMEEKEQESKMKNVMKEEPGLDWITAFVRKKEELEESSKKKEGVEQRVQEQIRIQQLRDNMKPSLSLKRKGRALDDEFNELFNKEKGLTEGLDTMLDQADDDPSTQEIEADQEFLIEEYDSENETLSDETREKEDAVQCTKIFYCSRTHSQLTQFVREVQKSPFGEDTRLAALASRQNMCVNNEVRKLNSLSLINERCLELQKLKSEKTRTGEKEKKRRRVAGGRGCPFYKQEALGRLRDRMLVEVLDIEQLVQLGRSFKACPYYASRHAIPAAEVVALPYNTLLHKSTREACGIKVKDNIVIIDEAHNLAETISNVHMVEVTGNQLTASYSQLSQYLQRYRARLKAKNLMYIRQILFIISNLIKYLGGKVDIPARLQNLKPDGTKLLTINDFLFSTQLDNLNLFKILRYCECSLISRKLHGFVEKYQPPAVSDKTQETENKAPASAINTFLKEITKTNQKDIEPAKTDDIKVTENVVEPYTTCSLMNIESLLSALTNTDKDGRIVVNKKEVLSLSSLKFVLLNPAVHFSEVVADARSLIVAGGTMQPISEFKQQLFQSVNSDRIMEFSCGHVIPPDNILPLALGEGSSGRQLDFTYHARNLPQVIEELGRVVHNICKIVPGGVICFFPSYDYEKKVYDHWESSGVVKKISMKKMIFREPKKSSVSDHVLTQYSQCIKRQKEKHDTQLTGGLLMSVVGGKMSEGINFSDDLGRCVVMVGLPYPNMYSPELKEKMDYLNKHMTKGPDGKLPGQVHYENLCMKAVNQSIGRAIRHKDDYAAIVLLDHRYLRPAIGSKLPHWINQRLENSQHFGPVFAKLIQFFNGKKVQSE